MSDLNDGADAPAQASAAPAEPMAPAAEAHPVAAAIDAWFAEVVAASPIDLPSQIHAHLLTAVSDLKQKLTA